MQFTRYDFDQTYQRLIQEKFVDHYYDHHHHLDLIYMLI